MNELIKELAKQAGYAGKTDDGENWLPNTQKFAWLIVKECFTKLTPYMDDQFIDDIEAELKEHFGVEE